MKKIILLLLAVQMSVSAQVEKVWSVVIEDVGGGFDLATMRESMLVSSSGSVLLNVSRGLKEDSPFLAWISSVRIPDEIGPPFRFQIGRAFRFNSATHSGVNRPPIPVQRGHFGRPDLVLPEWG